MALSKIAASKSMSGLEAIFDEHIQTFGKKSDGGMENVFIDVHSMTRSQLIALADLAREIPNSLQIKSENDEIRILFF